MREIYGICVNNLTIDQKKLVRLMQDTIPDFPSDNESVYADYITDCKQKNIFLTPEDWMQNYTFFDGWNIAASARYSTKISESVCRRN